MEEKIKNEKEINEIKNEINKLESISYSEKPKNLIPDLLKNHIIMENFIENFILLSVKDRKIFKEIILIKMNFYKKLEFLKKLKFFENNDELYLIIKKYNELRNHISHNLISYEDLSHQEFDENFLKIMEDLIQEFEKYCKKINSNFIKGVLRYPKYEDKIFLINVRIRSNLYDYGCSKTF